MADGNGSSSGAEPAVSLTHIAEAVGGRIEGDASLSITGLADLRYAQAGELSVVGAERFVEPWNQSAASACLAAEGLDLAPGDGRAVVRVDEPDLAMATVLEMFAAQPVRTTRGVHPSARVAEDAQLGAGVSIGPGCYIGPGAAIGAGAVLHANVVVMDRCEVGSDCVLWPGVVIGADGFGYRFDKSTGSLRKIPHIGTVRIGERVEIGANACVDRGKYAATIIGEGTKLDNLVQIGHNCRVGKHVVIAGGTMLAGSVTVGDYTQIGGMASIADHLNVGSQCKIAGRAALMHDMPDGETWAGVPGKPLKRAAREELAIQKLPDLLRQARKWTKQMD